MEERNEAGGPRAKWKLGAIFLATVVVSALAVALILGGGDLDSDGFSVMAGDCDNFNPVINPAASEACGDGVDNNCDGIVDEGCVWWPN